MSHENTQKNTLIQSFLLTGQAKKILFINMKKDIKIIFVNFMPASA